MLETWQSKERLLSNCTPRFLTDDEESREQPSSVRQYSSLLHMGVLGLIINPLRSEGVLGAWRSFDMP